MTTDYHTLVEKQREFFLSGGTECPKQRRQRVEKARDMILEHRECIDKAIFEDLHRPQSDVDLCLREIETLLDRMEEWGKPQKCPLPKTTNEYSEGHDEIYLVHEPLGVVLIIGPWNFPLFTILPFLHALAAGNTVIVKPSEMVPAFSKVFDKLVKKYFDERELACVLADADQTERLLEERFDHILYTGCPPVGKIVMNAAAKHLTPVTLELGGKNPLFVDEGADMSLVAKGVLKTKILNAGQSCTTVDYIITTPSVRDEIVEMLRSCLGRMGDLKNFDGYGRIVNERHFDRLHSLLKKSEGKVLFQAGSDPDRGDRFMPIFLVDVDMDDELMKSEIFGPILPILTVRNFDEALYYIKQHERPLCAYIYTKDPQKADRFVRETHCGGITINDTIQTTADLPIGGVGHSGMGRVGGKWGFDTFTHDKSVIARADVGRQMRFYA